MAHEARIRHAILASLLLLGACSDGSPQDRNDQQATPSAPTPSSPSTELQAVVYQTFAAGGDSDLHAVVEDGSRRTPLASTEQREHFRGISPDGWVIYDRHVSDTVAHLVSVRITGGEARVLDQSSDDKLFRGFGPDGRVFYQKATATGSAIHSIRPDGTAPAVLVDEPRIDTAFVAATPDGRALYQTCERPQDPQAPPECVTAGLYSVAPDGSDRRLLVAGSPRVARVTGDGRVIYEADAGGHTDVFIVRADGGDPLALASSPDDEQFAERLPDGRILYGRQDAEQWDVYIVNDDGTGNRALLTDPEDEFVSGITPSGRILFVRGPGGSRNLYAIDPDGTGLAVLGDSTDPESLRRITAEGRVIYSTRRTAGGFAQDDIYSVAPDGSDLRVLADSQEFEWFEDVAPDGRVVYMRCLAAPGGPCEDPGAQSDLYSVQQNGAGTTGLATSGDFEVYRGVTTNNRVVYQRLVEGQHDLHSIRTDGAEPRTLADSAVDERHQALH